MSQSHIGPTAAEWENQKAVIEPLYFSKTLDDLIREMEQKGFRATVAMYKKKFKDWGWKKNISQEMAREAYKKRKQRESEGHMSSEVYQDGRPVKAHRIERHLKKLGLDPKSQEGPIRPMGQSQNQSSQHFGSSTIDLRTPEASSSSGSRPSFPDLQAQSPAQHIVRPGAQSMHEAPARQTMSSTIRPQSTFTSPSETSVASLMSQAGIGRPDVQLPAQYEFEQNTTDLLTSMMEGFHYRGTSQSPGVMFGFGSRSMSVASPMPPLPSSTTKRERQPIHEATYNGHLKTVELILRSAPECLNIQGPSDETPLFLAAQEGHHALLEMLLTQGADPHITSINGRQPIHQAIKGGHVDCIQSLIGAHGARLNDGDDDGVTPFFSASGEGQTDILKAILDVRPDIDVNQAVPKMAGRAPIHGAAQSGHLKTVEFLRQHEADIDAEEEDGITALWLACQEGHTDVVRFLLENGANSNQSRTSDSTSALHMAAQEGHLDIAKLLISKKASIETFTTDKERPIHFAALNGRLEMVKLLADNGAELDCQGEKNNVRFTPLWLASHRGHHTIVEFLIEKEARVLV